ncbi:HupE/UreJ family protein [Archangium sp.]|uniref:HupE/UreJ family protein n=1 Tax=Archangium sp. TaxID=1872627 RepID=UPI002D73BA23|nr:HupE/UreJ family protein [Archangium sp.]HYO52884.1 HupE/UreJ family protein [Archangium sp.]
MRSPGVAVVLLLAAVPAFGHPLDMSMLNVQVEGGRVLQMLTIRKASVAELLGPSGTELPPEELMAAVFSVTLGDSKLSAGGEPCELTPLQIEPGEEDTLRLSAAGSCPPEGSLTQSFGYLQRVSGEGRQLFVLADVDGEAHRQLIDSANAHLTLARKVKVEQSFFGFTRMGVEHIFTGYDHLVFLLGLLLAGSSWRRLLAVVTSFTVAHSITLALAALSVIALPSTLVESAIALSIIVVAALNLLGKKSDHRWMLAFGFGLVHGFGFSSALAELELSRSELLSALFGFNVGVELGQATLVLLAMPLLALMRRGHFARQVELGLSLGSIVLGSYWLWMRAV